MVKIYVVISYSHDSENGPDPEVHCTCKYKDSARDAILEALRADYEEHEPKYRQEIIEQDERLACHFEEDCTEYGLSIEELCADMDLCWKQLLHAFNWELDCSDECKGIYTTYKIVETSVSKSWF